MLRDFDLMWYALLWRRSMNLVILSNNDFVCRNTIHKPATSKLNKLQNTVGNCILRAYYGEPWIQFLFITPVGAEYYKNCYELESLIFRQFLFSLKCTDILHTN
jgi:hypothetical protein